MSYHGAVVVQSNYDDGVSHSQRAAGLRQNNRYLSCDEIRSHHYHHSNKHTSIQLSEYS